MKRTLLVLIVSFFAVFLGMTPVQADQPVRAEPSLGGGFISPCNGHEFTFEASGFQIVGSKVLVLRAQGTGLDLTTGETLQVTVHLKSTGPIDQSGSFTSHVIMIFTNGTSTTTYRSVANVNVRPDEPVFVGFEWLTCAGEGRTPF